MTGDDDSASEDKTVFLPTGSRPSGAVEPTRLDPPPPPRPEIAAPTPPPRRDGRVEVGSVLNSIYRVERRIGGGGMGEVFQGANVHDEQDRVAIKVMLPALAADPNVQAMFFKEARTLTRLSHPAVVQYRVLAQEPTLGVFYIVTEFIDGAPLSDLLGSIRATSADLRNLLRRLAGGLKAAHALGTVHRDMSPDNVLLPGGRLEEAKIIDFGIAKDLDPSKATIVGDGFAGKLGFVAPEQFGDFGREIGPWTDVYSLGLVILSVAAGRNIDMGATLVDAIDKRRAGPDLSSAPPDLRPLLGAMLAADPQARLRSMDEVLQRLDSQPPPAPPDIGVAAKPPPPKPDIGVTARRPVVPLAIGGGVLVLILVGALLFVMRPRPKPAAPQAAAAAAGAPATSSEAARRVIEGALPALPCSWLDLVSATPSGGGVAVALTGVAASPQEASAALSNAARGSGVNIANLDLSDVSPVDPGVCAVLDAFRPIRADTSSAGRKLSTSQAKYTFQQQPGGSLGQDAIITVSLGDPSNNFVLVGVDASGLTGLVPDRQWFAKQTLDPQYKGRFTDLGGDTYRLNVFMTPPAGLQGLLLLTGKGSLGDGVVPAYHEVKGAAGAKALAQAAKAAGWKAEMVWYRTVMPGG